MRNEATFFPLSSTILHSLARGSEEVKGGGDSDLQCAILKESLPAKVYVDRRAVLRIYSTRSPANKTICGGAGDRVGHWDRAGV